jgi:hypothetical protein
VINLECGTPQAGAKGLFVKRARDQLRLNAGKLANLDSNGDYVATRVLAGKFGHLSYQCAN